MSNRTVPATAEGMPEDERELRRIWRELSPPSRAELHAMCKRLLAKETAR